MHFVDFIIQTLGDLLIGLAPGKKKHRAGLLFQPLRKPEFQQPSHSKSSDSKNPNPGG